MRLLRIGEPGAERPVVERDDMVGLEIDGLGRQSQKVGQA
jgi:hypothetical protein